MPRKATTLKVGSAVTFTPKARGKGDELVRPWEVLGLEAGVAYPAIVEDVGKGGAVSVRLNASEAGVGPFTSAHFSVDAAELKARRRSSS